MAGLIRLALVILLTFVVVSKVQSWSGNYETRVYCLSRRVRVCAYRTWAACARWKWISQPYYVTRYFCKQGWRHNGNENCNIAICNPTCKNGGTCTKPNQCKCTGAYDGPTCEGS